MDDIGNFEMFPELFYCIIVLTIIIVLLFIAWCLMRTQLDNNRMEMKNKLIDTNTVSPVSTTDNDTNTKNNNSLLLFKHDSKVSKKSYSIRTKEKFLARKSNLNSTATIETEIKAKFVEDNGSKLKVEKSKRKVVKSEIKPLLTKSGILKLKMDNLKLKCVRPKSKSGVIKSKSGVIKSKRNKSGIFKAKSRVVKSKKSTTLERKTMKTESGILKTKFKAANTGIGFLKSQSGFTKSQNGFKRIKSDTSQKLN